MTKVKILIVEDEVLLAMAMEDDLERRGYAVVGTAATAEDAVAKTRDLAPHVVLMDVRLKGSADGVDAAIRLRAEGLDAKVIFVTGSREPAVLKRIAEDHPSGLLFKPVGPEETSAAIEAALA